jgi:hypothetical protein
MFIVGMLTWWYTTGWKKIVVIFGEKLSATEDYFSIDILLGSLFAPYKQISASGSGRGTLQDKMREWGDRQFSRFFGAIIRLLLIIVGLIWLSVQAVLYLLCLVIWPVFPLMPLVGLVLMMVIGIPWVN